MATGRDFTSIIRSANEEYNHKHYGCTLKSLFKSLDVKNILAAGEQKKNGNLYSGVK